MVNQELSTSRLKLVCLEKRHLDDLFKIYSNPNAMLYWDDFPHKDKEKTDKLLNLFQKSLYYLHIHLHMSYFQYLLKLY